MSVTGFSYISLFKYELKADSFGPVKFGMTPTEASKLLGVPLSLGRESDEDDMACHYIFPNGQPGNIGFMVEDGRITRIDIYSDKIAAIDGATSRPK